MGYIVFTILMFAAIAAAWFIGRKYQRGRTETLVERRLNADGTAYENVETGQTRKIGGFPAWWLFTGIAVLVLLWGLTTFMRSYKTVEAGQIGVVYSFGEIDGTREEGPNLIAPWSSMRKADIKTQKHTFEVASVSKETQDVRASVTVNLNIDPSDVENLFREVGPDWFDRLVPSRVQQAFKETTVQYATVDIAPNREAVKTTTLSKLRTALSNYSINVVDVNVENLDFNDAFVQAIEAKQVATQEAQRQQQLVAAKKAEADQKIETARGEAEANRLLSESIKDDPRLLQLRIAETNANAIIALAKEGNVQMIPSNVLFTQALQGQPQP